MQNTTPNETPSGLWSKLYAAQEVVRSVPKDKTNTFSGYKYVSADQVMTMVGDALHEVGLVHSTQTTGAKVEVVDIEKGYRSQALVEVELLIMDPDTKESLIRKNSGFSTDKNGDKAIFKAITGATKYAYLKALGLATGDDPENDEQEYRKEHTSTGRKGTNKKVVEGKFNDAQEADVLLTTLSNLMKTHGLYDDRQRFSQITGYDSVKAMEGNAAQLQDAIDKITNWRETGVMAHG